MRGAGDLIGTAQSGLPRFRIADLERQAGADGRWRNAMRASCWPRTRRWKAPRGQAARVLLWLMGQDEAIRSDFSGLER